MENSPKKNLGGKKRLGSIIKCKACGKEYYVPKNRELKSKFCSLMCMNHLQYDKTKYTCKGCKKTFDVCESDKKRKFCSLKCRSLAAIDQKERRKRHRAGTIKRRGYIYGKNIKKQLKLTRELYCDYCDYNEYEVCLDIHHVNGNADDNSLSNISVLCAMCHRKLHNGIIQARAIVSRAK